MDGGGGGLVTFVTPLVKEFKLPMTLLDMVWMPPTTEAAKFAPGSDPEDRPPDGMDIEAGALVEGVKGVVDRYKGS